MRRRVTHAWHWRPTSRPLARWDCRFLSPVSVGTGFSRQRVLRRRSSTGSMRPPSWHWPIRRCDLGLPISGMRFSRASSRRRRRSAHSRRPRSTNGGRSSRSSGSGPNEEALSGHRRSAASRFLAWRAVTLPLFQSQFRFEHFAASEFIKAATSYRLSAPGNPRTNATMASATKSGRSLAMRWPTAGSSTRVTRSG